jgi:paired amphipathic helix protein Sin3a
VSALIKQVWAGGFCWFFFSIGHMVTIQSSRSHSFCHQIQTLSHDTKSSELVQLFQSDRDLESTSPRLISVYRLRAEDIVGSDENLYKINLVSCLVMLCV